MLPLYDITRFTLLDYPDLPAAILWFAGCNLRCSYCYNPDIVFGEGHFSERDALDFLEQRRGLLEGVVLSGGESTLYPRLLLLCRSIKALGYKIKLDTNTMRPDVIGALLENGLLDYVALDYKGPASKMSQICGGGSEKRFWESMTLLQESSVAYEVRTTFHPDLLNENDIALMAQALTDSGYSRPYYVQIFQEGMGTVGGILPSKRRIDYEKLALYATVRS